MTGIFFMALPQMAKADPGDIGDPRSSYELGYANKLEGKTVIISVFVNTPSTVWTAEDIEDSRKKLSTACDYICDSACNYDKQVSFIYDYNDDASLKYRTWVNFEADSDNFEEAVDQRIQYYVNRVVNFDSTLESYNADNVFIMLYFKAPGRAYSIVYDGEDIPEESLIVYSDSTASVYAHEMLHLFGAHDFYAGAEYSRDVIDYIEKYYADDIMYSVAESNGRITAKIADITAYHLGWLDSVNAVSKYPELDRNLNRIEEDNE